MQGLSLNRTALVSIQPTLAGTSQRSNGLSYGSALHPRLAGAAAGALLSDRAVSEEKLPEAAGQVPVWKRFLDIALVVLLAPAALLISAAYAVYVKLVSRGPVFFAQERIGQGGKPFRCLKFRTMRVDNESGVHKNHLAELMNSNQSMKKLDAIGDGRIIPLGDIVRSSGLDELPQLINVIRGQMSMIGPRPCTRYEYDLYEPWQKRRFSALPGLTGLWQVSGKNRTTFDEMIRLDIRYAESLSVGQDLVILAKTIPVLLIQIRDNLTAQRQHRKQ